MNELMTHDHEMIKAIHQRLEYAPKTIKKNASGIPFKRQNYILSDWHQDTLQGIGYRKTVE